MGKCHKEVSSSRRAFSARVKAIPAGCRSISREYPWKENPMSRSLSVFHSIAPSAFLAVGACLTLSAPLRADIVFTNLTSPCCGGYAVEGASFSPESIAAAFTPTSPDRLAGARVVVFQELGFGGDPNFNM